jgi:hypothetical protein
VPITFDIDSGLNMTADASAIETPIFIGKSMNVSSGVALKATSSMPATEFLGDSLGCIGGVKIATRLCSWVRKGR